MPTVQVAGGNRVTIGSANNGHISFRNAILGKRGNCHWAHLEIDTKGRGGSPKYSEYVLRAKFNYLQTNENPHEVRDSSKVGIWVAVHDQPMEVEIGGRTHLDGMNNNFLMKLDELEFGQEAKISIGNPDSSKCEKIQIALGCIPYFNQGSTLDSECQLDITLFGIEEGTAHLDEVDGDYILFSLGNTPEPSKDIELKLLNEFGAFSSQGKGNSIHPKQLFTLEALRYCLKERHSPCSIAYIGTDTTENLRSVIRALNTEGFGNMINTLFVYHTVGWDATLMKLFGSQYDVKKLKGDGFKIIYVPLPKDGTLPKNIGNADITIATYVTPWAIASENNIQYFNLIKRLMDSGNAELISIDPVRSDVVIRSFLENFNLDEFYRVKCKFVPSPLPGLRDSKIIDCNIWRKGNEQSNN
jgi:hypothetical protein